MSKSHSESAFAPMCEPPVGSPWFAISYVRHAKRDARDEFVRAVADNGRGWRGLKRQGWRIVRVKVVAE